MVSGARRQGAVEAWAAKHPFLARMSGQADLRAEGEKVAGARSPFRTLYGSGAAGLAVGALIAFAAFRFVAGLWQQHGVWLFVMVGLAVAVVVVLVKFVKWMNSPLRGIRY